MKRCMWTLGVLLIVGSPSAIAQPPGGFGGPAAVLVALEGLADLAVFLVAVLVAPLR